MWMTEILDLKMAENEKTYEQQQREYLWEILKAGLTIISDEDEGHGQVVNYPNVCAIDNLDDMEIGLPTLVKAREQRQINITVPDFISDEATKKRREAFTNEIINQIYNKHGGGGKV